MMRLSVASGRGFDGAGIRHEAHSHHSTDIALFNQQYGGLTITTSARFHDRFLIIDNKRLYLIGASLKDLGRKCFAFASLDAGEITRLKAQVI